MRIKLVSMVAVLVGFMLFFGGNAAHAQEPIGLFNSVNGNAAATRSVVDFDPTIVRRRAVSLNPAVVPTGITRSGSILTLNFFDGIDIDVVLENIDYRDADHYTWKGYVLGEEGISSITLVVNDDVVIANVRSAEHGYFQIRVGLDGFLEVREIDDSQFAPCEAQNSFVMPSSAPSFEPRSFTRGDTSAFFDLMVVYTPAARIAEGGTVAMEALIDLAVSETNSAYTASGINSQVRLVHQQEVAYVEKEGVGQHIGHDLSALQGTSDGDLDSVHGIRDTYGADLVSLFVQRASGTGVGYVMLNTAASNNDDYGFSVVHRSAAAGNLTLAHEMGHNMGCTHAVGDGAVEDDPETPEDETDPGTEQDEALYYYSHGWRFTGNSTNVYRTVMAYAPGSRVGQFSNPFVNFDGQPTGRDEGESDAAYNVLSINNAASEVANWRNAAEPLATTPTVGMNSAGPEGGPFAPSEITYTLTNTDDSASINWTASASESWLTLSSLGGTITTGNSVDLDVTVNAGANALTKGQYSAIVTITDTTNTIAITRTVNLNVLFYQNLFDSDLDPGWTKGAGWEYGIPLGQDASNSSPDPTSGYTGSNVYGVNILNGSSGAYPFVHQSTPSFLVTGAIDLSESENTSLTFARWLNHSGPNLFGTATVDVSNDGSSWTSVYALAGDLIRENSWSMQTYDISAVADGEATVYIRWGYSTYTTGDFYQFTGWNIDDVQISGDSAVIGPPTDLAEAWVDFAYVGTESGTVGEPFSTIAAAVTALKDDGTGIMKIKGDTADSDGDETPSIDKAMTIQSEGGTVTIGTP